MGGAIRPAKLRDAEEHCKGFVRWLATRQRGVAQAFGFEHVPTGAGRAAETANQRADKSK
jgi:hypothetical protein